MSRDREYAAVLARMTDEQRAAAMGRPVESDEAPQAIEVFRFDVERDKAPRAAGLTWAPVEESPLTGAGVIVCAVAAAFPMMGTEDWRPFVDNIRANGMLNPIVWASDGSLLDGRNRLTAWLELGNTVESCPSVTVPEGTDELAFVAAQNVARRNLSSGQRACVAVLNEGPYRSRAAARKAATQFGVDRTIRTGEAPEEAGRADTELARDYNTSEAVIRRARKLRRENGKLFVLVLNGSKSLDAAKSELDSAGTFVPSNLDAPMPMGKFDAAWKAAKDWDSATAAEFMRALADKLGMEMVLTPKA